jgi:hypothetical protein
MNERGHRNLEPARFRFSIAGISCLTSLVAVHLAFPSLWIALVATICAAITLALLMYPALSAGRMRMTYLGLVGTVYLMVAGFLCLTMNY